MTILEQPADIVSEDTARPRLEAAWGVKLHRFPRLHAVDWYAEREDRLVGYAEIKVRTTTADTYPTVFLSLRKYASLTLIEHATGIPSTFVAGFACGSLLWIRTRDVDARAVTMGGRADRGLRMDREPMVEVPIADMISVPMLRAVS